MMRLFHFAVVAAVCAAAGVCAQTTPPKSQAKPPSIVVPPSAPAKAAPKTLGGKVASGQLLTRDELRACLKRLDAINDGGKGLEPRRISLDAEKAEIAKGDESLKAELAEVNVKLAAVREWEGRSTAHGGEVEAFNKRMKALDEMTRNQRENALAELNVERERLTNARAELDAAVARVLPPYQDAAKAYNQRALARDAVIGTWNERNRALNDEALKLDEERQSWLGECANRPYREDDELAIKAGK
jgi:predicted  nucleic acid-binding Zn-ribbon protein